MSEEYRVKAIKVDARQVTVENAEELAEWCGGVVQRHFWRPDEPRRIVGVQVPTLDNVEFANLSDWIVKHHLTNRFSVHNKRDFEQLYEKVPGAFGVSPFCGNHVLVQHRDARPPWCESCKLMGDGNHKDNYNRIRGIDA